ncbi:MAG: CPBP family intramembrane metalloprotease [Wenzhouxiangella sp.]|nr:MAG: CPBP family intramembrane metalloprotease [Wenzhouxiangella sp.]
MPRRITYILAFELGLGVLALVLALLFGLRPWLQFDLAIGYWLIGGLATLPMVAGLVLLSRVKAVWIDELQRFMREVVVPMFAGANWWMLMLVALAAGIGEELLFRGVIQTGLGERIGPGFGLIASALLFGLVHAMSRAYFIIATLAGLYLGLLFLWTGNLLVVILVHFLYDWIALHVYVGRHGNDPPAATPAEGRLTL